MILSFRTDRLGQTVQTQIRLLLFREFTVTVADLVGFGYSLEPPFYLFSLGIKGKDRNIMFCFVFITKYCQPLFANLNSPLSVCNFSVWNVEFSYRCDEKCKLLLTKSKYSCISVNCGVGYHWQDSGCELCPLGTYADQERQLSCTSCPPGETTSVRGAYSSTFCFSTYSSSQYNRLLSSNYIPHKVLNCIDHQNYSQWLTLHYSFRGVIEFKSINAWIWSITPLQFVKTLDYCWHFHIHCQSWFLVEYYI